MRSSQRGMSYWSVMFGVSFFALMIKLAATIGPIYLDYFTIDKMLQQKFRDPQIDKMELKKFELDLTGQMERNGMREHKLEELMVVRREGDKTIVEVDYEERKNLMSNLDVVAHFKKSYSTEKPDGYTE